jgi:hypothetical protein
MIYIKYPLPFNIYYPELNVDASQVSVDCSFCIDKVESES